MFWLAGQVVGRAEPRRQLQCRPGVGRLGDALAGQEQAVGRVAGVRHERADRDRGVRAEQLVGARIQRLPVARRCTGVAAQPAR